MEVNIRIQLKGFKMDVLRKKKRWSKGMLFLIISLIKLADFQNFIHVLILKIDSYTHYVYKKYILILENPEKYKNYQNNLQPQYTTKDNYF